MNQIEVHPNFQQRDLIATNQELGILTQAWSPIGGGLRLGGRERRGCRPLQTKRSARSPRHMGSPAAQVILRWHLQEGRSAIPKSCHARADRRELDVFDFDLSAEDLAVIASLDTGVRGAVDPAIVTPR